MPIAIAFDVIARYKNTEYPLGTMVRAPNPYGLASGFGESFPPGQVPAIDLILRPSPAAARNTLDLFEISGETLTLKNIPLSPPPTR